MAKIKITESELRRIVEESVNEVLTNEGINDFKYAVKTGAQNAGEHISKTKGVLNKVKSGVSGFKKGYDAEQMNTKLSGAIKLIDEITFELQRKGLIDYKTLVKYQNMWNAFDREITALINTSKE